MVFQKKQIVKIVSECENVIYCPRLFQSKSKIEDPGIKFLYPGKLLEFCIILRERTLAGINRSHATPDTPRKLRKSKSLFQGRLKNPQNFRN